MFDFDSVLKIAKAVPGGAGELSAMIGARIIVRLGERENPSPEEKELAELLTMLIDEYEERRYPIRKASPQRTLQHLMEARSLTQKDLWKIFGSKGITRYFTGSAPSAKRRQKGWLGFSMSAQSCSSRERPYANNSRDKA